MEEAGVMSTVIGQLIIVSIAVDTPWISANPILRQSGCEVPDLRMTCHYTPPEQQYAFYEKLTRTLSESDIEQTRSG
jgi:hypothetical protein